MKAGGEFLFWLILFAEILAAWGVYGLVCLVRNYRARGREIARLQFELGRHKKLLHYRSESAERPRLAWAR